MTMPWVPGVYIMLDYSNWFDEPVPSDYEPRWCSWERTEEGDRDLDMFPEFPSAREAVQWWRQQGVDRIFVSFDPQMLGQVRWEWAGVGSPPADPESGQVPTMFSADDPRGDPEGAWAIVRQDQERFQEKMREMFAAKDREVGGRLRRRRETLGLSVDEVASRMGVEPSWVVDIEAGLTTMRTPISRWVDLVWATQVPWPDARRTLSQGLDQTRGWTNLDPLTMAERLVAKVTGEDEARP